MKIRSLSIAALVATASLSSVGSVASAAPLGWQTAQYSPQPAGLGSGLFVPGGQPLLQQVQFFWGGSNYCWYDFGWKGPGYYYCGYNRRRGYGWGGPVGWHGWSRGGHGGGYYRGGYNGGHYRGGNFGGGRGGNGHFGGGHNGGGNGGGFHGGGGGHGGGGHGGGNHGGGHHH